jgi:hypothetical protein
MHDPIYGGNFGRALAKWLTENEVPFKSKVSLDVRL